MATVPVPVTPGLCPTGWTGGVAAGVWVGLSGRVGTC